MSVFEIMLLLVLWAASLGVVWSMARYLGRIDIASERYCGWPRSTGLTEPDGTPSMVWHFERRE